MKWAGAVLILSFSLSIGLAAAWEEKRRVRSLDAFCRLLTAMREQISVLRLPGKEIFARYSDPFLAETGFLAAVSQAEHSVTPMAEALRAPGMKRRLSLSDGDYAALCTFAEKFGQGDSAQECARCDAALFTLHASLERTAARAPENARILRAVSISAGILLVLLLF